MKFSLLFSSLMLFGQGSAEGYLCVYPNPTEDEVSFRYQIEEKHSTWTQPGTLRVFAVSGAEVYRQSLPNPVGIVSWQPATSGNIAGMYFYQLTDSDGHVVGQGKVIYQPNQH